jgi:hypothetical protein
MTGTSRDAKLGQAIRRKTTKFVSGGCSGPGLADTVELAAVRRRPG